jgi:hypothetical protein
MSGRERDLPPNDTVGDEVEGDLGAERGAQPHRPTTVTVGGGTESDRPGEGTSATPGLSGGSDRERMSDDEEET